MTTKFFKDLAERVFWTAAQAGFAVAVPVLTGAVPERFAVVVPVLAAAAATVKGFFARKVGDPESASTLSE